MIHNCEYIVSHKYSNIMDFILFKNTFSWKKEESTDLESVLFSALYHYGIFCLNALNYLFQQTLMPQPNWQPGRWRRTLQPWRGMVYVLRSMATCWLTALQRAPAEKLKWPWTLLLTSWPLWNQEFCTHFSSGPTRALVPVGRAWPKPRQVSCSPSGWECAALPSLFLFPQGILPLCFDLLSFAVNGTLAFSYVHCFLVHLSSHFRTWFYFFWQRFCLSNKAFACIPWRKHPHLCIWQMYGTHFVLSANQTITMVLQAPATYQLSTAYYGPIIF